jgi:hypothetical protein
MEIRGAGGTSGGVGQFFLGVALTGLGLYLFLSRVTVVSSAWTLFGYNGFGVTLVPLTLGLALLFFNGRSVAGWVLSVGSFLVILIGIITNLSFFFMPTNLIVTLLMIGMMGAGFGLILRSLKDYEQEHPRTKDE